MPSALARPTQSARAAPENRSAPPAPRTGQTSPDLQTPPAIIAHVDRACTADKDCVAAYHMYESDGHCCWGCKTDAVTKRWLTRARRACSAMGAGGCPMKKCATLAGVACHDGSCSVTPP